MPDLNFQVEGAEVVPYSAAPLLVLKLRVTNANPAEEIHTVALHCQIQIEATRRHYAPEERARLLDLFGEPERWGKTLRNMLWTHSDVIIPGFVGSTVVHLPVHCSFDLNVAATKYFHGLEDGEVPLLLLFSGSVFHATGENGMQVAQISWEREAKFRLPIKVWQQMMDLYYPNSAWLCLQRDVFDRLYQYKVNHGIPTWEKTVEEVLDAAEEKVRS
jgi:hypothetical protein